jgi:hypothetical protein
MVMKTIILNTCQSYERFGKKMGPQPCTHLKAPQVIKIDKMRHG